VNTPKPVWNPDVRQTHDFFEDWAPVPDTTTYDNAFKVQWELFLRHVHGEIDSAGTCWKGQKGCNWLNWRCKAGKNAAGSMFRHWCAKEAICNSPIHVVYR
jgi:hypothetical protein